MKSLAIVTARGGSKRLPGKNLRMLGGRPLICWTLDAAEDSDCFDKIVLSSDEPEILGLARKYRRVEASPRPERLSGDTVTALEVVWSIVGETELREAYDVVTLLLPTAPFRSADHVRGGFELLDPTVDGVVSLTTYEFPPQLGVTLREDLIVPVFDPCPLMTGETRSQDQAPILRPNGGFYTRWMESFLGYRNFWKGRVKGYVMSRGDSVDIDDAMDLEYAEFLLSKR